MPDKQTHDISLVVASLGVFGYELINSYSAESIIISIIGILSGVFITPDYDLAETRISVWTLYGKLFKHRGISHYPVIGTFTRIIYIGIIPVLLFLYFEWNIPWKLIGNWFLWLCVADLIHIILDILVSRIKKI